MSQPNPAGSSAKEMKVFAEEFPNFAMVASEHRLQRNALRVQHARDVMVGDDEEVGGRAKGGAGVGEETRVNVTVRRDDGQRCYGLIKVAGDVLRGGVGGEEAVGIKHGH